jgi:glycosyltransferase involved in cell wall biosynthesis
MSNNIDSAKKILTVAIPAYGRSDQLESLIKQFKKENVSRFTLLICDDASPEDLTPTVSKYLSQMPNLKFIRNKDNLGFSGNVCGLYDMAETDFIWFVCDDDAIIPGCIDKIADSLEKYDPTVAIYNHQWVNPYGVKNIAGVKKDLIFNNISEIKDYNHIMRATFLSTLVLKRLVTTEKVRQTDYKSNVFVQITLALQLLGERFKFGEIAEPIIFRHVGFKYGEFFKFYIVDHLRAIFAMPHKLDNKKFIAWSIREIPTAFKLYMSQKLGLFKYRGTPTKRTIKEIFRYYGIYSLGIFSFVPIYYLTPTFILKHIYKTNLYKFHDKTTAEKIYNENINRAYSDERKTGFTEYR